MHLPPDPHSVSGKGKLKWTMIKHPSPVPTWASVHAVWLVQLAPEELVSPSARSSSPLLAPAELLLHGDLQGEHGGDQEAAQRQGSLHLRVWFWTVHGKKVVKDLLSLLPFGAFIQKETCRKSHLVLCNIYLQQFARYPTHVQILASNRKQQSENWKTKCKVTTTLLKVKI